MNGSTQIYPHQRSGLRAIEFSVNVTTNSVRNENIGKAVIIINSQTLQLVEYFFCKVFGDGWIVKRSRKAYISIVYPECTPFLHQLTYPPKDLDTSPIPLPQELTYPPKGLNTSPMQLTPSQTYNFGCQRVITKPAYILEPCKHQLST